VIGQVLGHCRVVAKIGEGGMGVVYRAHDEVLHRDVALKVVNKGAGLDASASQNLLHEARASSSLAHPNICTIYEVGETEGDLYIVMELVEGKSLCAMSGGGGLPAESVLRYGVQIASALARAHDRGIVHRDLKTANIVVTSDGLAKVLDFGLARRVESGLFEGSTQSFEAMQTTPNVGGTLPYMAPEVLRGEAADYRSDLWALGVVLYEAASGRLPFGGRTGFEISSAIMRELPKPLGPPVPPGLWAIIQRCLTKEPTQRYQRASEVQAALEAVQSAAIASTEPSADHSALRTTVLHSVRHIHVRKGDFLLLVGTTKGAFLLRSNARRTRWEVGGPYFHGHAVYAMAYDSRGGQHRIWASTQSYWGTMLRSSDDFGKSWTNPHEAPIRFPADTGLSLKNIWQISLGPSDQPDVLYCGVESPLRYSKATTQGKHGRWCVVCSIIPTALVGCRVTVVWRCTPLCSTKRIPSVCTSRSQPVAFTGPTMVGVRGRREIEASALCSCPTSIPSSGSVYTRLRCILPVPNVFTCKIIGACIAPMTMPKTGRTLPMASRRILVSPW